MSVIENVAVFVSLDNTHFSDQFKTRLFSQLIKSISRVLQKLLNMLMAPLFQHRFYH